MANPVRRSADTPPHRSWALWIFVALFAALLLTRSGPGGTRILYSDFKHKVEAGQVAEVQIGKDTLTALPADPAARKKGERWIATRVDDPGLVQLLDAQHVKYEGQKENDWLSSLLFVWVLPMSILFGFWALVFRRMRPGAGMMSIGRARAKLVAEEGTGVTFADVAGVDEAVDELREIVDFLSSPEKFRALGARIPKGVLLVGPPGTGKTLLARAVAGEAKVPFFSLTGSEFVEMFVGVGAARVRDLFQQAAQKAPCIVFIDELDAMGKARGPGTLAGHDEREQTLNQLLAEMDGFDPRKGLIIMAATNRPEILDPALLRPGRFDRQVLVDRPDVRGREAILRVHARGVKLGADVDLRRVAALRRAWWAPIWPTWSTRRRCWRRGAASRKWAPPISTRPSSGCSPAWRRRGAPSTSGRRGSSPTTRAGTRCSPRSCPPPIGCTRCR